MASLAQSLFSRPGERRATEGALPAHHGGWGARATRRNPRVATVYTNGPKRLQEAVFANLCTLLRSHACPQRRNSVHKCPKTAPRGRFRRSVYTVAYPQTLARPGGATGPTTSTTPWPPVMPGPRALGPDGPSVSCQVHAPGRPIVSVAISVPVCVWCRRWLESKTHALAGQTPPVLRLKAARYKTGGVVGHTAFERVCCARRCHARSEPLLVDNHHIAYVCQIVELSRR